MDMYVKPEHDRTEDEQAVMTKQIVLQSDQYGNLGKRSYSAALVMKLPNDLHIQRMNKDTHALRIIFPEGTNLFVKSEFRATLEKEWRKLYPNAPVTVWTRIKSYFSQPEPLPAETAVAAYDPTLPAATLDLLPDVCMYLVGNMENEGVALWRLYLLGSKYTDWPSQPVNPNVLQWALQAVVEFYKQEDQSPKVVMGGTFDFGTDWPAKFARPSDRLEVWSARQGEVRTTVKARPNFAVHVLYMSAGFRMWGFGLATTVWPDTLGKVPQDGSWAGDFALQLANVAVVIARCEAVDGTRVVHGGLFFSEHSTRQRTVTQAQWNTLLNLLEEYKDSSFEFDRAQPVQAGDASPLNNQCYYDMYTVNAWGEHTRDYMRQTYFSSGAPVAVVNAFPGATIASVQALSLGPGIPDLLRTRLAVIFPSGTVGLGDLPPDLLHPPDSVWNVLLFLEIEATKGPTWAQTVRSNIKGIWKLIVAGGRSYTEGMVAVAEPIITAATTAVGTGVGAGVGTATAIVQDGDGVVNSIKFGIVLVAAAVAFLLVVDNRGRLRLS